MQPRRRTFPEAFRTFACRISVAAGTPLAFGLAVSVVAIWLISGPWFHYSDTWQLVINTGTTVVTFLMVFLIQNAQNRDIRTVQLKLDELIRGVQGARNELVNLEEMSDEELERVKNEFKQMHDRLHTAHLARQEARRKEG